MFKVDDKVRVVTEGKLQGFTGVVKSVDNTDLGTYYFVFVDSYSDTHQAREINRMFGFDDRGGDVPFRDSDLQPLNQDKSNARYFVDKCAEMTGINCSLVWREVNGQVELNCTEDDLGWGTSAYNAVELYQDVDEGILVEIPGSEVHI